MPSSSNPFQLVGAAVLFFFGIILAPLGFVGLFAETGEMRLVFGMLAVGALFMMGGAVSNVLRWRRALAAETRLQAVLHAAVEREQGTATEPPAVAAAKTAGAVEGPVLAHWTYGPGQWREYAEKELSTRKSEGLWQGIGIAVLGTLLLPQLRDASYALAFGISAAVGGLIFFGRLVQGRVAYAANTATVRGEVIISPTAVVVNGRFHVLQDDHFRFGGVRYRDDAFPPLLEFRVEWNTRGGTASDEVRVPVPLGREEEARALARSFPHAPAGALAPAAGS